MSNTGNIVQCGVYMLNYNNQYLPICFSGDFNELHISNDIDDAYILYPGFKVLVGANTPYWLDNTNGTRPKFFAAQGVNQGSRWDVYYMGVQITREP